MSGFFSTRSQSTPSTRHPVILILFFAGLCLASPAGLFAQGEGQGSLPYTATQAAEMVTDFLASEGQGSLPSVDEALLSSLLDAASPAAALTAHGLDWLIHVIRTHFGWELAIRRDISGPARVVTTGTHSIMLDWEPGSTEWLWSSGAV